MSVVMLVPLLSVAVPVPNVSRVSVASIASAPLRLYSTRTLHFGNKIFIVMFWFSQCATFISSGTCNNLQELGSSALTSPY